MSAIPVINVTKIGIASKNPSRKDFEGTIACYRELILIKIGKPPITIRSEVRVFELSTHRRNASGFGEFPTKACQDMKPKNRV